MTTVFDITLQVAKEVTDVIEGAATGGSTTTLVDTALLASQPADFFNGGKLFIKSGTHADKVFTITDFTAGGTVTFVALAGGAIVSGVRYAIIRNTYPFDQIMSAVQRALDSTFTIDSNGTLTGDGETLVFTLPTGVSNVIRVEQQDASGRRNTSNHVRELHNGTIRFDYGYAPNDGDVLVVYYKTPHPELVDYTTVIKDEINLDWLKHRAAVELLYWGVGMYGGQAEYRIEERMNKIMLGLKFKSPRRGETVTIHTAGA